MALRVDVGIAHSCALVDVAGTNKVYCWGDNEIGSVWWQIGDTFQYSFTPQPVNVGTNGLPASESVVSLLLGLTAVVQL
ncbi:hypothetical protein KOY49_03855 [Candidatus Minimicrobia vallesae]|uniref:Uncharacterized protein n=1 Tax=Candidatus Minimicrobia vallesae TaxID=2841264 RepID=A0A8F1MA65_9BACT|nr:RCC1 domain-containing protein [Candidatus Minimicrobia vallesae]QWQ31284.1 hypothetical protein KOY49_03855 [Candidatus Minimicrobia vallesae]